MSFCINGWWIMQSKQIQNGNSWDIRKNIKSLGRQIFQEDFKKYGSEIKGFLKENENVNFLQKYLRDRKKGVGRSCCANKYSGKPYKGRSLD
jgi:hypothetical protein